MAVEIKKTEGRPAKDYADYQCGPTQARFTPDPGLVTGPVHCGVCRTVMDETRGCFGPRGWAQAMGGGKEPYDMFVCPHVGELWHKQATKLRGMARDTPSARLAQIFTEEANDVLAARVPSKEDGLWSVLG